MIFLFHYINVKCFNKEEIIKLFDFEFIKNNEG